MDQRGARQLDVDVLAAVSLERRRAVRGSAAVVGTPGRGRICGGGARGLRRDCWLRNGGLSIVVAARRLDLRPRADAGRQVNRVCRFRSCVPTRQRLAFIDVRAQQAGVRRSLVEKTVPLNGPYFGRGHSFPPAAWNRHGSRLEAGNCPGEGGATGMRLTGW